MEVIQAKYPNEASLLLHTVFQPILLKLPNSGSQVDPGTLLVSSLTTITRNPQSYYNMERRYEHQSPSHKTVDELQNRDWILLRERVQNKARGGTKNPSPY